MGVRRQPELFPTGTLCSAQPLASRGIPRSPTDICFIASKAAWRVCVHSGKALRDEWGKFGGVGEEG